jgi:hypothetical protein
VSDGEVLMNNIEYALLTIFEFDRTVRDAKYVLSLVALDEKNVFKINSEVYLTTAVDEYTIFYCCNAESYKCFTSGVVEQYEYAIENTVLK